MKYFTMQEMIASSTADSMNINNEPDCKYKDNIIELVDNYLDPMRLEWADYCSDHGLGSPAIRITSGYRCERLNSVVGGSSTSAHLIGAASDLVPANGKFEEFKKFVIGFFDGWDYDELLIEKNSKGSQWIHLAYKSINGLKRKKCFSLNVK